MDANPIDEYIRNQPEKTRDALHLIRKCILNTVPDAEELINYKIPAFALEKKGKRDSQIMMAAYPNHIGFYPHPTSMEKFKEELKIYKCGKGSVQFPLDKPIPEELIVQMVLYRKSLLG